MKKIIQFWLQALPFTAGVSLSLISLCYLITAYEYGMEFDDEYIWLFFTFFFTGFPMLIHGINLLANDNP